MCKENKMGLKVHYFTLDRKDIEIRCMIDNNAIKDRQLLIRPFLGRAQYIDHWDLPPSDSYT